MPTKRINHGWKSVEAQTADATPLAVTASQTDLPANAAGTLSAIVVGRKTDGTEWKRFHLGHDISRGAGVATVLAALTGLPAANGTAGAALWAAAVDDNANGSRVTVTGAAGVTIDWVISIKFDLVVEA